MKDIHEDRFLFYFKDIFSEHLRFCYGTASRYLFIYCFAVKKKKKTLLLAV